MMMFNLNFDARKLALLILALIAYSSPGHASDSKKVVDAASCDPLLGGKRHHLVFSGRDDDMVEKLQEYADQLFSKGGLLERLGLSVPDQIIQFLPGSEVNTIAANGRMPIGHWHDGANIVNSGRSSGVIYEMVIHGGRIRHSIYRDDVPLKHQYSILNHVAGHNHFGANTRYQQVRTTDLNQAAYELDHFVETLKQQYDRQEISEWYQYLLSLSWAQDISGGDYETPEDFVFNLAEQSKPVKPGQPTRTKLRHPKAPTANILQAFVANLPTTLPTWKVEMARRFERLERYIPGAVNTKVMNEGFATLMQELIPPHTQFRTFDHAMEYCCLIDGIIRPSLSNPYWLGLEAWRRIRAKFNARPENKDLDAFERDRRFIAFATTDIISKMHDMEFLRYGLDDSWLAKFNLALTRQAQDFDPNLPPPDPNIKVPAQFEVVTRDYKRVRESLIRQVKGFAYQFPRVVLRDLRSEGTGMIQLELTDSIGRKVALERHTIPTTLMIMARILHAPVSLESTFDMIKPGQRHPGDDDDDGGWGGWHAPILWRPPWTWKPPKTWVRERVRVIVHPDGKLVALKVLRDGDASPDKIKVSLWQTADDRGVKVEEVELPELTLELEKYIDAFKQDLDLGNQAVDFLKTSSKTRLEKSVTAASDAVPTGLLLHIPTTAHAVTEYWTEINHRLFEALRQAVLGKRGLIRTTAGVRVKALPDTPYFSFDQKSMERMVKGMPVPNVEKAAMQARTDTDLPEDLPLDVQPVDGDPGRHFWGEDPKGQGEGDGDDPGGRKTGEGGIDPTFVNVSLDDYADALSNLVELPNLRPLDGKTRDIDEARGGWAYRRNGPAQTSIITRKAAARGLAHYKQLAEEARAQGKEVPPIPDPSKLIRKGLSLMPSREWAIKHFEPHPSPEINAVVTFMMDFSGSYMEFVDRTKQMLYDLEAILKRKYDKVLFRYVAFDGNAIIFENPDEFFRAQLGGGTSYTAGLKKVLEVYENFPVAKWDRYGLIAGDFEDFDMGDEVREHLDQVRLQSRFLASVRMAHYPSTGEGATIERIMKEWHETDPYVSFVDLAPENDYNPLVLRRVFKNDESD